MDRRAADGAPDPAPSIDPKAARAAGSQPSERGSVVLAERHEKPDGRRLILYVRADAGR